MKIAARTVAEALEGWSRQAIDNGRKLAVEVLDFDTEEKLRRPTDVTRIEVFPLMAGGGGLGKILLGIAMIAVAILNPGIGGMMLSQAGVSAVAGIGISMVLGGIMSLFMKAPTISKSEDPDPSKYIGTGKNTTSIGTLMGIGGGRTLIGGQFLSIQVNSSEIVMGKFPESPA
jgi:predicted phage tail protein